MRVERKILRLKVLRSFVIGKVVQQDRAKDGTLRLNIRGKRVRDAVIRSCHDYLLTWEIFLAASGLKITELGLVDAEYFIGKVSPNSFLIGVEFAMKNVRGI
jgi:hypothetical protein